MFTNKKRGGIDTFVCTVSLHVAETPKTSIKDQEPPTPIIPFGIVAYGLVGQPFSKQLYSHSSNAGSMVSCFGHNRSVNEFLIHLANQTSLLTRDVFLESADC